MLSRLLYGAKYSLSIGIISAAVGSIVYRLLYSLALSSLASKPYVLKLISSLIVVLVLILPLIWNGIKRRAAEGREKHA